MMISANLKLWKSVEETDPKHTKKANVKGNKITSIKPQYQILKATEQWGSYGQKWGFKDINLSYELINIGLVVFKAIFYYPDGEFELLNSIGVYRDNAQTKVDDDFAKKIETDALTKALSKLGFNSDVFMGRFDDIRYVDDMDIKHGNKEDPKLLESEACEEMKKTTNKSEISKIWSKYPQFQGSNTEFYKITATHGAKIKDDVKDGSK